MMTGVFSEKMYLPNLPRRPPVAALSSLSRANGMSFVNNLFANPIGVFLLSQPGQTAKGGGPTETVDVVQKGLRKPGRRRQARRQWHT